MNAETIRLNITLPRHLVEALDVVAGPRKRSHFISEAIHLRIQQFEKEKLETLLAEGYQASRQEGIDIAAEFEPADIKGWDEY